MSRVESLLVQFLTQLAPNWYSGLIIDLNNFFTILLLYEFVSYLDSVVVSPPEIGGKQFVVLVDGVEVLGQLSGGVEVPDVDVGVRRDMCCHVGSAQDHRNHVVGQKVVELLSEVVLHSYIVNKVHVK